MIQIVYLIIVVIFAFLCIKHFKLAVIFFLLLKPFLLNAMVLLFTGIFILTLERMLIIIMLMFLPFTIMKYPDISNYKIKKKFILPINILLGMYFINIVFPTVQPVGGKITFIFAYILDNLAIIYIVVQILDKDDVKTIINGYIVIFLFIGIYGIMVKIIGNNPYLEFFSNVDKNFKETSIIVEPANRTRFGIAGRLNSVFYHTISYGGHLALIAPIIFTRIILTEKANLKFFYSLTYFVVVINLLFTNTRSAILFFLVSHAVLFMLNKKTVFRVIRLRTFLPITIFAASFIFINPGYFNTVKSALFFWQSESYLEQPEGGSTLLMRQEQLSTAFDRYLMSNFVLGHGAGLTRKVKDMKAKWNTIGGAESIWIVLMVDYGILGTLVYLWMFLYYFRIYFRLKNSPDYKTKVIASSILGIILGYGIFISATGEMKTISFFLILIFLSLLNSSNSNSFYKILKLNH